MIAIVDPVPHTQGYFAILLIVSFRKTRNLQSLESHNQTRLMVYIHVFACRVSSNFSTCLVFSLTSQNVALQITIVHELLGTFAFSGSLVQGENY